MDGSFYRRESSWIFIFRFNPYLRPSIWPSRCESRARTWARKRTRPVASGEHTWYPNLLFHRRTISPCRACPGTAGAPQNRPVEYKRRKLVEKNSGTVLRDFYEMSFLFFFFLSFLETFRLTWHASLPPFGYPAHIIPSVTLYSLNVIHRLQVSLFNTGTWTSFTASSYSEATRKWISLKILVYDSNSHRSLIRERTVGVVFLSPANHGAQCSGR